MPERLDLRNVPEYELLLELTRRRIDKKFDMKTGFSYQLQKARQVYGRLSSSSWARREALATYIASTANLASNFLVVIRQGHLMPDLVPRGRLESVSCQMEHELVSRFEDYLGFGLPLYTLEPHNPSSETTTESPNKEPTNDCTIDAASNCPGTPGP